MVSVIHMSSPFIWKRYPSLLLFKEICRGMYFISNYDNTNGDTIDLLFPHSLFCMTVKFNFLISKKIFFFNSIFFNGNFLVSRKNFQILSYPKIPVLVNLLYMFLCHSESSISCWKEIIEENNFCQGTMQIVSCSRGKYFKSTLQ